MAIEIERKFLVKSDHWRDSVTTASQITQGYLAVEEERSVRVRVKDDMAVLTVKVGSEVAHRSEFEFEVPLEDARELLRHIQGNEIIRKTRNLVPIEGGLFFEIDEFHDRLEGLVLAEIELVRSDQTFPRPGWLGKEVSHDPAFLNENLRLTNGFPSF